MLIEIYDKSICDTVQLVAVLMDQRTKNRHKIIIKSQST